MLLDLFYVQIRNPITGTTSRKYVLQVIDHKVNLGSRRSYQQRRKTCGRFYANGICHYRSATLSQSDNGTQEFVNAGIIDLLALWNIQHVLSAPRRPQTNGVVERANVTLSSHKPLAEANQDRSWERLFILHCTSAQLNSTHETIGISPYEYVFSVKSWKEKSLIQSNTAW